MTAAEARERLAGASVARLASVGATGEPHVVPICFVLAGETIYHVIDGKPKGGGEPRRLRNLRERPAAAVLADHYEDDWRKLWWVRADGCARVLERGQAEAEDAIGLLAARYPQQRAVGPVVAVDVSRWSGWSAGGLPGEGTGHGAPIAGR